MFLDFEFFGFCRFLEVNIETLKNTKSYVPVTPGLKLSVMRANATESNWNQCCNSGCFFSPFSLPPLSFLSHTYSVSFSIISIIFILPSLFLLLVLPPLPSSSISQFASLLKFMLLAMYLYFVPPTYLGTQEGVLHWVDNLKIGSDDACCY